MTLRSIGRASLAMILALLSPAFAPCTSVYIQSFDRNTNGVTFYSVKGALRIEVCSDRIIHVIASPTRKIPLAVVPTAILPCRDSAFNVVTNGSAYTIETGALQVRIDRDSGAISFFLRTGTQFSVSLRTEAER